MKRSVTVHNLPEETPEQQVMSPSRASPDAVAVPAIWDTLEKHAHPAGAAGNPAEITAAALRRFFKQSSSSDVLAKSNSCPSIVRYALRSRSSVVPEEEEVPQKELGQSSLPLAALMKRGETRYVIVKKIPNHPFVYLGRDGVDGSAVAIRLLRMDEMSEEELVCLQRGISLHLQCTHPNIQTVFGLFEERGSLFVAQELATFGDLRRILTIKRKLPEKISVRIISEILHALAYLHGRDIVHCNVKPEYILLTHSGNARLGAAGENGEEDDNNNSSNNNDNSRGGGETTTATSSSSGKNALVGIIRSNSGGRLVPNKSSSVQNFARGGLGWRGDNECSLPPSPRTPPPMYPNTSPTSTTSTTTSSSFSTNSNNNVNGISKFLDDKIIEEDENSDSGSTSSSSEKGGSSKKKKEIKNDSDDDDEKKNEKKPPGARVVDVIVTTLEKAANNDDKEGQVPATTAFVETEEEEEDKSRKSEQRKMGDTSNNNSGIANDETRRRNGELTISITNKNGEREGKGNSNSNNNSPSTPASSPSLPSSSPNNNNNNSSTSPSAALSPLSGSSTPSSSSSSPLVFAGGMTVHSIMQSLSEYDDNDFQANGSVRLAGFNFARKTGRDCQVAESACATVSYMAPEVIEKQRFGPSSDVWSAGIVLYEMLWSFRPFNTRQEAMECSIQFPGRAWGVVSDGTKQAITKMLVLKPADRFLASDVATMLGFPPPPPPIEDCTPRPPPEAY